jgi:hypothetical protein
LFSGHPGEAAREKSRAAGIVKPPGTTEAYHHDRPHPRAGQIAGGKALLYLWDIIISTLIERREKVDLLGEKGEQRRRRRRRRRRGRTEQVQMRFQRSSKLPFGVKL